MSERYVVIVDGYSAGNLLAPEFLSRQVRCLHVQTTREIWPILLPTFRPDDFEKKFTFTGDTDDLVAALKTYRPLGVFPGTETGVELADSLASGLGVTSNGTDRSAARRNKYLMNEAVREAGLSAAKQIAAEDVETILNWRKAEGLSRIVVKPPKSAGTDSVAICDSEEEIRAAAGAILGKTNKLGLDNPFVLAQEFLEGTEYFLNTVSWEGKAHFTDIWKYRKRTINDHSFVYDCNELLPFDAPEARILRPYVESVLAALQIAYGSAHTEVMLTNRGPVLVETGARLDGLSVPTVNTECLGFGPLDLTVDAWVDPGAFAKKTKSPYPLKKHARTVYLTSYRDGTVQAIPGESALRELESFFQMRLRVKPGSAIKKTIDYFTAPGFLTLAHANPEIVEQDYRRIRQWEQEDKIFLLN